MTIVLNNCWWISHTRSNILKPDIKLKNFYCITHIIFEKYLEHFSSIQNIVFLKNSNTYSEYYSFRECSSVYSTFKNVFYPSLIKVLITLLTRRLRIKLVPDLNSPAQVLFVRPLVVRHNTLNLLQTIWLQYLFNTQNRGQTAL